MAAHYSGEPEASPVSFFSRFSLCDLFLLIWDYFEDELGFLFLISFQPKTI
jgi:hypothetical protein